MSTSSQRPLSPHLQIYRLPITAVLSISHRFSGALLGFGVIIFVLSLVAVAAGPQWWDTVRGVAASWPGLALLVVWTWVLYFHFCNGIRHLLWDLGYGFELSRAGIYGWSVLMASVVLTAGTWWIAAVG